MTETITHEGVEYRKVSRKAEAEELVEVFGQVVGANGIFTVDGVSNSGHIYFGDYGRQYGGYYVLEPVESEPTPVEASPTVIELLANISRRLYEAEKEITELNEKQAVFFDIDKLLKNRVFDLERQNRVQAYEINELYREVADRG